MISHEAIQRQLERLSHLRKFPADEASVADLYEALKTAETEIKAAEWVTEWKNTFPYAPTPADIRIGLQAPDEPMTYWKRPEPTKCEKCSDTGWRQVTRGMYTGVVRCECQPAPAAPGATDAAA